MFNVRLIAAVDDNLGIARHNKIPWRIEADRDYFRQKLDSGPVVMGLKTFVSNGRKPYGSYENTVFGNEEIDYPGVATERDAVKFFKNLDKDIWVAGGGQIFKLALPYATELYITRVQGSYDCDVFFPEFQHSFEIRSAGDWQTENGYKFRLETWAPKPK